MCCTSLWNSDVYQHMTSGKLWFPPRNFSGPLETRALGATSGWDGVAEGALILRFHGISSLY